MKLQRLDISKSRKGGWIIRASNQGQIKQVLQTNLPDDEYRLAHRASGSYWISESGLLLVASAFSNWADFAPLISSTRRAILPLTPPPRSQTTQPPQHYHLSTAQAPSLSRAPQDAAHQAHCTQAAAEGFAKQADTFDVVLITQNQRDRVTMQIARHLAVGKYKDIIAALQLLFRDVGGDEIINPREDGEDLRTLLRVLLRPIARLNADLGQVQSEYRRAVIAAFEGEDKAAEW